MRLLPKGFLRKRRERKGQESHLIYQWEYVKMILSPQFMMQAARLSSKVCGTILLIVENPRLGMRKMGIMT